MERRKLGRTGLDVSIMGMGTGGHDPLGQKSGRPESEMRRLLHRAFDLGINWFDTSPGYLDSESILGRALKDLPRGEVVVSTKIALAAGDGGQAQVMRADAIEASVDGSLRRLGLDSVDVMLVAVSGPEHYEVVMDAHVPALLRMKQQGKIRFLGSSEQSRSDGSHEWLRKALPAGVFDVAMVAHNLINQSAQRTVLPYCVEHAIGVANVFTVRNVFSNPRRLAGVLGDLRERGVVDGGAALDWLVEEGHAASLAEAAYRFVTHTPGVTAAMTGTLFEDQLEANVRGAARGALTPVAVNRLRDLFGRVEEAIGN